MNIALKKLKYRFRSPLVRKRHNWFRDRRGRVSPLLVFILIISISVCGFSLFESRLKPVVNSFAQARAKNIATQAINLAITEKLANDNVDYQTLITLDKNSSGNVGAIQTNIASVNKLKSELMICVYDKINSLSIQTIEIPIGSLLNNELLAGRGPKIPLKLLPVGDSEIVFKNNFSSSGINQTKHEIILEVETRVAVVMPTGNTEAKISTQIPVAETIIVGSVPNTYTNIEGTNKTSADIGIMNQ